MGPDHGRRFSIGCVIGGALSLGALFWMLTDGTGNLFQSGLNTDFYDAQARALLAGHWWMPSKVLSIEGIVEHHHTYMYYGPVPAILRMPVLLFTHSLDGRLTGASMLLAFAVALVFTARLSWRVRKLVAAERPVSYAEATLAGALMIVVGVGSNFLFLASDTIIYHEAEVWGAALAIAAFDFVVALLIDPRVRWAALACLFATLSMLSRGSVGVGPVVALAGVTFVVAVATLESRFSGEHSASPAISDRLGWLLGVESPPEGVGLTAVLAVCVMVPLAAYAAINEIKFGTLFSLPLDKQVETMISPHRRAVLAANGGSLFGIKFIPTALMAYLRPDAIAVTRLFPFLMFPRAATVIGHLRYDDRDWASSIPASMPMLSFLGLVGLGGVFWPRRRAVATSGAFSRPALPRLLRIPVLGAAAGTVGVLTIAFIANRYLADFMPLLILCAVAGFHLTIRFLRSHGVALKSAAAALLALVMLAGLWSSTALALVYQRELRPAVPLSQRAGFVGFQESLDRSLFGNPPTNVLRVATLPRPRPAGTLAIIGNCEALYQSAGIMSGWDAIERSEAAGHFKMRVTFPAGPTGVWWPVLSNGVPGASSWLALRSTAPGEYQFGYLFEGSGKTFLLGPAFAASAGRSHVIDAVLDSIIREVSANVDGTPQYELGYFVRGNRPIYVGANPFGGRVAAHFPGGVTELPVTTPICHSLLARFRG